MMDTEYGQSRERESLQLKLWWQSRCVCLAVSVCVSLLRVSVLVCRVLVTSECVMVLRTVMSSVCRPRLVLSRSCRCGGDVVPCGMSWHLHGEREREEPQLETQT